MTGRIEIPPFCSGGLMLSYRCSSTCKHCIYRCSPAMPDEWMSLDMAEKIFARLSHEALFTGLHIAGGEATLNMDLLVDVIRLACSMHIPINYLETNAYWCSDLEETKVQFQRLHDAGLRSVMISASMFHGEFVPFDNTERAVEAAREVFGDAGFFAYPPHLYTLLARLPDQGARSLEDFCEMIGIENYDQEILELFPVTARGRAVEELPQLFKKQPASAFKDDHCCSTLLSPHHIHIDLYGNIFTGSCCGISPATIDNLHPEIDVEHSPVFSTLCDKGPCGLLELAQERGIALEEETFVGKCDLCYRLRRELHKTGEFAEESKGTCMRAAARSPSHCEQFVTTPKR